MTPHSARVVLLVAVATGCLGGAQPIDPAAPSAAFETPAAGTAQVDTRLIPALRWLSFFDHGRLLLDALGEADVILLVEPVPAEEGWGLFDTDAREVIIDPSLTTLHQISLATLLVHELTHVRDFADGRTQAEIAALGPDAACLEGEVRAMLAEVQFWAGHYQPDGKDRPEHEYERWMNQELARYLAAPERFVADTAAVAVDCD